MEKQKCVNKKYKKSVCERDREKEKERERERERDNKSKRKETKGEI